MPLASSAAFITTYVFEGNVENPRQFQTAFGLLLVRSATAALPPSASMMDEVVSKSDMGASLSKFLGYATPKTLA